MTKIALTGKEKIKRVSLMGKISRFLAITLSFSIWGLPAWGGDPFRTKDPRDIGEKTEEGFKTLFEQGNYKQAKTELIKAESAQESDPLTYAMIASLAYTEEDWETMKVYAQKTIKRAEELKNKDPLRSNLYLAVGNFLEGAYIYNQEDPVAAVNNLPAVFQYLDQAQARDANDPELNLIKGYLDLFLAVNLPFSTPEDAIARFQNYAAPNYLVYRGLAVAYRDLDQPDKALPFVDQAIKLTPDNPELYYLKAQILRKQDKDGKSLSIQQTALQYFDQALAKADQLPQFILKSLRSERNRTLQRIEKLSQSPN